MISKRYYNYNPQLLSCLLEAQKLGLIEVATWNGIWDLSGQDKTMDDFIENLIR